MYQKYLIVITLLFSCTVINERNNVQNLSNDENSIFQTIIDSLYINAFNLPLTMNNEIVLSMPKREIKEVVLEKDNIFEPIDKSYLAKNNPDIFKRFTETKLDEIYNSFKGVQNKVENKFSLDSIKIVIISKQDFISFFENDKVLAYKNFYQKYPKSNGFISFSNIAINEDANFAVCYVELKHSVKNAWGEWIFLNKNYNKWKIVYIMPNWIS